MFYFIFGIILGFVVSFLVLKVSIVRSGAGEMKVCRRSCPYYKDLKSYGDDDE